MGKKKIDKLKLIDSKLQRNVAFCKRKRGFLKKAIELSCLCDQKIFIIIYDEERKRTVQFSSDENFEIKQAYESTKISKQPLNIQNYEKFTNDDYQRLEQVDFRSVRYKKKHLFGDDMELISDLESNLDIEDQDSDAEDTKQKPSTSSKELEMPDAEISQCLENTILVPQLSIQKPRTMVDIEYQESENQVKQNLDDVSSKKKFGSEHGQERLRFEPKVRALSKPEQVKEDKIANSKRVQKEMEKQIFKAMNLLDQHKIPKIPSVIEINAEVQTHPEAKVSDNKASPNTAEQPQIPNTENIKAGTPLNQVLQEFMKQNQMNNIQKIFDKVQKQEDKQEGNTKQDVENMQLEGADVQITEQNEKNQRHILDLLIQAKQLQQKQQNLEQKPDHESQKNVQTIINTAQQLFMNNGLNIQQQLNQQNQHIENLSQNLLNLVQYHQQVQATQPKIEQQQFQRVVNNNRDVGAEHQQQQQQNILNNTSYFNFNNINMQNHETPMFQTQDMKQLRHPQQVNLQGWNIKHPQQQHNPHQQQQSHVFMHQQPLQNMSPMLNGQSIFTNHNNAPVPNIHEFQSVSRQNHQMNVTQQQVLGQNQMILGNQQQVVGGEKYIAKKRLTPLRQREKQSVDAVSVGGKSPQFIGMDILGGDFVNERSQQSNDKVPTYMFQGAQNRMQKHLRQKVRGQGVEASDIEDSLNDFFKDHHSNK